MISADIVNVDGFGIHGGHTLEDCLKWLYEYSWKIFNNHVDNQKVSYASVYWGTRFLTELKIRCKVRVEIESDPGSSTFKVKDEAIASDIDTGDTDKSIPLTVYIDGGDIMKDGDNKIYATLSDNTFSAPAHYSSGQKLYIYPLVTWTSYTLPETLDFSMNRDVDLSIYGKEIDGLINKAINDIAFERELKESIGEESVKRQIEKQKDILDREIARKVEITDISTEYTAASTSDSKIVSDKAAKEAIDQFKAGSADMVADAVETQETLNSLNEDVTTIKNCISVENLTCQYNDVRPKTLFLSKLATGKNKIIVVAGHKSFLEDIDFKIDRNTRTLTDLSDDLASSCEKSWATAIFKTKDRNACFDGTWMYNGSQKFDGSEDLGTIILTEKYTGYADGTGAANGVHMANGPQDINSTDNKYSSDKKGEDAA